MIAARGAVARRPAAWSVNALEVNNAANDDPGLFNFNAKLLALPAALQALNATFTRASTATVNQGGTLVTLASGQFGTDQDTDGLYDYVAEPAATNLCLYSEDQTNAAWAKSTYTIDSNTSTAPDGTITADKIVSSGGNGSVAQLAISVLASTNYVFSFYAMRGTATNCKYSVYNNNAGADIVASTSYYSTINSSTWTRVIVQFTTPVGCTSINVYLQRDNGAAGTTLVWGAQLETGNRATSYIKTVAATATRAASVLSVPTANIPGFNSAGYTLFADWRESESLVANRFLLSLSDGTTSNRAHMLTYADSVNNVCTSGGVSQFQGGQSPSVIIRRKNAFSLTTNSFLLSMGGSTTAGGASGVMPVAPTVLYVGGDHQGGGQPGRIRRAGIVTRALTQAQINGMTA